MERIEHNLDVGLADLLDECHSLFRGVQDVVLEPVSPGEHYDATQRARLDPRDRRQSNARRCCYSAWDPNADRRANSLNCPRKEWSTSEADSHVLPADHLQACALVVHILVRQIDPAQYEASWKESVSVANDLSP
jgi:hypothetical protein